MLLTSGRKAFAYKFIVSHTLRNNALAEGTSFLEIENVSSK